MTRFIFCSSYMHFFLTRIMEMWHKINLVSFHLISVHSTKTFYLRFVNKKEWKSKLPWIVFFFLSLFVVFFSIREWERVPRPYVFLRNSLSSFCIQSKVWFRQRVVSMVCQHSCLLSHWCNILTLYPLWKSLWEPHYETTGIWSSWDMVDATHKRKTCMLHTSLLLTYMFYCSIGKPQRISR